MGDVWVFVRSQHVSKDGQQMTTGAASSDHTHTCHTLRQIPFSSRMH